MVWFCSDNGPEGGGNLSTNRRYRGITGGLRGRKRSLYNGGVCVPALVRWPGVVRPGAEYTTPCSTLDYLPTIVDLVGARLPTSRPIDGISLLPLLEGTMKARPVPIPFRFVERQEAMFGSPTFGIIDNELKYLTNFTEDGSEEAAYNLVVDPFETRNVISDFGAFAGRARDRLRDLIADFERSHYGGDYIDPTYRPTTKFQGIDQGWLPERKRGGE
jgi:arylsulfatase A-like enzyme